MINVTKIKPKRWMGIVLVLIVMACVAMVFFKRLDSSCERARSGFIDLSIDGEIQAKFLDTLNHAYPTVLLRDVRGSTMSVNLTYMEELYDDIAIGDRVQKVAGNGLVRIEAPNGDHQFWVNSSCD